LSPLAQGSGLKGRSREEQSCRVVSLPIREHVSIWVELEMGEELRRKFVRNNITVN